MIDDNEEPISGSRGKSLAVVSDYAASLGNEDTKGCREPLYARMEGGYEVAISRVSEPVARGTRDRSVGSFWGQICTCNPTLTLRELGATVRSYYPKTDR